MVLKKENIDNNVYFMEPLCKEGNNKERKYKYFIVKLKSLGTLP